MDTAPVTQAYLESLTTSDLIKMADNFGVEIPPDLDRIFIIEELLELSSQEQLDADEFSLSGDPDDDEADAAKTDMADSKLIEPVPLPVQYNITFIEVMIRDPLWAFVFWEIKAQDKDQFEKDRDFDGYYLKVTPEGKPAASAGVFTVPVSPNDTAWYLGLAPAIENEKSREEQSQYKVELCVRIKGEETVLAVSSSFRLPLLHELPSGGEAGPWKNPLVRLSGYEDFHIIRSHERLFRPKRGAPAAGTNPRSYE